MPGLMATWFRGPLRPMLWDRLTSARFLDRGVVSPEFVRTLLAEHDCRRRNNDTWLWSLLVLDLWLQQVENSGDFSGRANGDPHGILHMG